LKCSEEASGLHVATSDEVVVSKRGVAPKGNTVTLPGADRGPDPCRQAILGSQGVSLGAPGALRSLIGVGAYLGLQGVLAIGLGTVICRGAGAIAVLVGLFLVIPALDA
jgi:hypothetical protein